MGFFCPDFHCYGDLYFPSSSHNPSIHRHHHHVSPVLPPPPPTPLFFSFVTEGALSLLLSYRHFLDRSKKQFPLFFFFAPFFLYFYFRIIHCTFIGLSLLCFFVHRFLLCQIHFVGYIGGFFFLFFLYFFLYFTFCFYWLGIGEESGGGW
ncbi:hypothetical protein L873DRAFT_153676 [Choiromyces venosus 120613-1]|uniref:Uncharacterized protein n=1 Tax=Choiromyces venosus 120613-1 TaxID=1336337 RepID=A0A3N4J2T3_9PEZI|nr:hypothetical protein L873DRAFT_153676 [Choiromyces venosus 120613-1]